MNLIWWISIFNWNLSNCCNCSKDFPMINELVPPHLFQAPKLFEPPIYCLVTSTNIFLYLLLFSSWSKFIRGITSDASISIIAFHPFIWYQFLFQKVVEYFNVRPCSTRKRAFDPTNPPRLDTYSNFISNSRTSKFMWIPTIPEWGWFLDSKISSIYGQSACASIILTEPIFKAYLLQKRFENK